MPMTWGEASNSRELQVGADGAASGIILRFWVASGEFGASTEEQDVFAFVADPTGGNAGIAPNTWPNQYGAWNRANVKMSALGGGMWHIEVQYGAQSVVAGVNEINTFSNIWVGANANRGPEFECDTTGKSTHVTTGLAEIFRIQGGNVDVIATGTNATATATGFTLDGAPTPAAGQVLVFQPGNGWPGQIYNVASSAGATVVTTPFPGAASPPIPVGQTGGQWVLYSSAVTGTGGNTNSYTGGSAQSYNNAINVSLDGVGGADIFVPTMEFTVSGVIAPFNQQTILTWKQQIGARINNESFWGFPPGEVLYIGSSAKTTDGYQFRITHKFYQQDSAYNLTITPTIIIPFKQGWDYVWVAYGNDVSGTIPFLVPIAAITNQMYLSGDFSILGFGT